MNVAAANAEEENVMMRDQIEELRSKAAALEAELEVKTSAVKALEQELHFAEKRRDSMLRKAEDNLKEVESQRDSLRSDLLALKTELKLAQSADKDAEVCCPSRCLIYRASVGVPVKNFPVLFIVCLEIGWY